MNIIYDKFLGRLREADGGGGDGSGQVAVQTGTASSLTVSPGEAWRWTPSGDGTLTFDVSGVSGKLSFAFVEIVLGESNAVAFSGFDGVEALSPSKVNLVVLYHDGAVKMARVVDEYEED
jgi:hypothetical protein